MLQEVDVSSDIKECSKWVAKIKADAVLAKKIKHNNR